MRDQRMLERPGMRGRRARGAKRIVRDRRVTAVRRSHDGDIVALCDEAADWSPRSKQDVIDDYEHGGPLYYVQDRWGRSNIQVCHGATDKYLRLDPKGLCRTRMSELPDG